MTWGRAVRSDGFYPQDLGLFEERSGHFHLLAGEPLRGLLIAQHIGRLAIVHHGVVLPAHRIRNDAHKGLRRGGRGKGAGDEMKVTPDSKCVVECGLIPLIAC